MSSRSSLPPFGQVLSSLTLSGDDETRTFDSTVGRRPESTRGDIDARRLPELAVALGAGASTGEPGHEPDLQVAQLIGRGGMGEVWLARQQSLGREVALKTAPPGADAHVEQALVTEGRITGALEHPSIVPVHALGRASSGQPVLVMKRIEGVVWRDLLRSPDHPHWITLGPDEPLVVHVQILMQLCNALELAHRRGFVHRDIKPANVMVGSFGEVYLVDWGLAVEVGHARRESGRLEGTPAYMAPEMIAGLPVDARTDVYLLGATLHEVLTGAPPHAGSSLTEVLRRGYGSVEHDYPDAPPELVALCRDAMSREASLRPASARAFRDGLAAFLSHRTSAAILRRGRNLLAELGRSDRTRQDRRTILEECLVTLRLALAEWPVSPSALAALDEWRRMALSVEIEEGHLTAAKHLLDQMDRPAPELVRKVTDLETRLDRERQEADRGRRAAFEGDVSVGARERRLVGSVLALCIVVIAMFSIPHSARGTITALEILIFSAAPALPFALLVVVMRRRLLGNVFTRRTVALLGLLLALILVHRTVAWLTAKPPEGTLVSELLMIAGVCGAAGITLARWWFVGMATGLAGALLGIWNPGFVGPMFTTTALSLALAGVVSWSRDARATAAGGSPD